MALHSRLGVPLLLTVQLSLYTALVCMCLKDIFIHRVCIVLIPCLCAVCIVLIPCLCADLEIHLVGTGDFKLTFVCRTETARTHSYMVLQPLVYSTNTVRVRRSGDTSSGHGRLPTDVPAAERLGFHAPLVCCTNTFCIVEQEQRDGLPHISLSRFPLHTLSLSLYLYVYIYRCIYINVYIYMHIQVDK